VQKWLTDQDAVWRATLMDGRNHVLNGVNIHRMNLFAAARGEKLAIWAHG